MRIRKNVKIRFFIIIVIVIMLGSFFFANRTFINTTQDNFGDITNDSFNINDHTDEFNIETSHYYEKNYDRYVNYKSKNPNLTDDEVINRVNIGIDSEFYTNIRKSNLEDGILVLCNKYNKLSEDYVPLLVDMENNYSYDGSKIHPVAYEAFKYMVDAASDDDIKIYNVSAYRSYSRQAYIYDNYKNRDGVIKADTYSARAGHSEHQTGLATDINTSSSSAHFENTKEYAWLIENSYKYGFILRYPKGKEYITGYKYEPWHYRYVGVEVATYIHENDITYEEYYANFLERD